MLTILTNNRVTSFIAKYSEAEKNRLEMGIITQEQVDALNKSLDMEMSEYVKFQELKSLASVDGTLTLDEAQTIYMLLGNTPDQFNRQSVGAKAALTQIFSELLKKYR